MYTATHNPSVIGSEQSSDTISTALRSWGGLPNFELYEINEPFPVDHQSPLLLNHPEIELLPEDMIAFFDEHEQTDPQLELPWWLRKITVSSKTSRLADLLIITVYAQTVLYNVG